MGIDDKTATLHAAGWHVIIVSQDIDRYRQKRCPSGRDRFCYWETDSRRRPNSKWETRATRETPGLQPLRAADFPLERQQTSLVPKRFTVLTLMQSSKFGLRLRWIVPIIVCLALTVGCAPAESPQGTSPASDSSAALAKASPAVTDLATHLGEIDAKMYGAYWCPYCQQQKEMFGTAVSQINYIECDPEGENSQTQLCRDADIEGFPAWEINGQLYTGLRSLDQLADLSGYEGDHDFNP